MDQRVINAKEKFLSGYNCAQSVLSSFVDTSLLSEDVALKMSCGFGAGMARQQEVCGAITGAIMALGLIYGRGVEQDNTATENAYAKIQVLLDSFKKEYGTIICKELLDGCDLTSEKGQTLFREKGYLKTGVPGILKVCQRF